MTTYKLFDKNRELKMMEICDTSQSRSHFHNLEIHGKSRTPRKVKMRRVGSVKDLGAEDQTWPQTTAMGEAVALKKIPLS